MDEGSLQRQIAENRQRNTGWEAQRPLAAEGEPSHQQRRATERRAASDERARRLEGGR